MKKPEHFSINFDARKYSISTLIPPFTDIILQASEIDEMEYGRIIDIAKSYPSDPRLVEMIRCAGDASAKVPYLIDEGETPESILETLRSVANAHIDHLNSLPSDVQSTIHTLLSVNKVPVGYEKLGIPALLEIDRIQREMTNSLRQLMSGRRMAEEFYQANLAALKSLDQSWHVLRQRTFPFWARKASIPEHSQMAFDGYFENGRLKFIYETYVIVDPPRVNDFNRFIPPILQRPLPEILAVPETGSADWLIREVGKVGRHFTRAILEIIREHLAVEKIALEVKNYALINQEAREILDEFMTKFP
jgi:hypothetical protein